mmetsp:Transcript_25684/g.101278  ORF Transcript_25684/g.101278 Transcript_25684/m.101278 type:complete len:413 (-) Transcript_25684:321-1559(-)
MQEWGAEAEDPEDGFGDMRRGVRTVEEMLDDLNVMNGSSLRLPSQKGEMVDEVPVDPSVEDDMLIPGLPPQVGHTITTYLIGSRNQILKLLDDSGLGHDESEGSDSVHDLVMILTSITTAIKTVGAQVKRLGLPRAATANPKVLNQLANETWINTLRSNRRCSMLVSEDREEPVIVDQESMGRYIVVFDPLTGLAEPPCEDMGAIFGIFRQRSQGLPNLDDVTQPGRQIVAAGYALYGSSTVIMFSIGDGVHGFTLDPTMSEFILTHENVKIPFAGHIYAVNEGHTSSFRDPVRRMLTELKSEPALDGSKRQLRYVGSMVADLHRTIMYGGVYMYPEYNQQPAGRLKLLYEAAPLAFLVEQAGGQASNGEKPILDIIPQSVHHRLPVYMGSEDDVSFITGCFRRYRENVHLD